MRVWMIIAVAVAAIALAGCGDRVRINNGEVGKVLTSNGFEDRIRTAGSMRMPACMPWSACPQLVRLDASPNTVNLSVDRVYLPNSNVDLTDVAFSIQFEVEDTESGMNFVFDNVPSERVDGNERRISTERVYQRYLAPIAEQEVIACLRGFTVEESLSNVAEISRFCTQHMNAALDEQEARVNVLRVSFSDGIGQPPEEVIRALRNLYAVDAEKAREISMLEAQLEIEEQRQLVQQTRVANNMALAESAGLPYSEFVRLQTMERFADAAESGSLAAFGYPVGGVYE